MYYMYYAYFICRMSGLSSIDLKAQGKSELATSRQRLAVLNRPGILTPLGIRTEGLGRCPIHGACHTMNVTRVSAEGSRPQQVYETCNFRYNLPAA
jgi:hypothetical protein